MVSHWRCRAADYAGMGEEMVKRGLAGLALLILAVILVSCGVFSASPFSSNLPFIAAFVNLEDRLDSFFGDRRFDEVDYLFQTIRAYDQANPGATRDVLFLLFRLQDTGDIKLLVFDSNLELEEELDNAMVGPLILFNSNSFLTPSGAEFVVGLEVFDGESLQHVGNLTGAPNQPDPGAIGFSDNSVAFRNYWAYVDLGSFKVEYVNDDWSGIPVTDDNISAGSRELLKLTCDRESEEVIIHISNSSNTELVRYPFVGFGDLDQAGILSFPYGSTFDTFDGMITFEGHHNPMNSHYTRDGIILSDEDGSMTRCDFSGQKVDDWDLAIGSSYIISFDISGNFYYYFNFGERKLYKAHTWWG